MRIRFSILLLFLSSFCFSQIIITGKVYEVNSVLQGAAVYLNNTMLGTTTNAKGEFTLPVKKGLYQLVISYLGYEKIIYNLNTSTYKKPLKFVLKETSNTLNEIVVKKTIYNQEWRYNLESFKKDFLGTTKFAEDCKIENPKVLHFDFNRKTNLLIAIARKPLIIKNKSLGYEIIYELDEFERSNQTTVYLGYARYKTLKGGQRKQRKWAKNRLTAYNGSYLHFYQSILRNTTYKDGFLVHQFKRLPNPERPTALEIKKAQTLIRLNLANLNFSKKIENPKTKLDSALVISRKARLPKFKDYLYKSKVPIKDIIERKPNGTYFNFKHNLVLVYTKEKEEMAFILRNTFSKLRTPTYQTSTLLPNTMPIKIEKNGMLENPLAVLYEGYWSFEKFANSLPLDYVPVGSSQ
ncbi:carboxypeptidase-like regulatory domain-containing protein [uncultured Polaribacter sp.]|uniref:carboxypeptidase-like regulatory domain-containing protein n=1 Tax=uncultured Polaribacter sp. TaxID=174711 RepID=UPI0026066E05|nr:carboxypeptidase-like regulatory domain-containing protein [uncultured Polaribacter sp.]